MFRSYHMQTNSGDQDWASKQALQILAVAFVIQIDAVTGEARCIRAFDGLIYDSAIGFMPLCRDRASPASGPCPRDRTRASLYDSRSPVSNHSGAPVMPCAFDASKLPTGSCVCERSRCCPGTVVAFPSGITRLHSQIEGRKESWSGYGIVPDSRRVYAHFSSIETSLRVKRASYVARNRPSRFMPSSMFARLQA